MEVSLKDGEMSENHDIINDTDTNEDVRLIAADQEDSAFEPKLLHQNDLGSLICD